ATHDSSLSTNPNTLRLKPFLNRLSLKSHQFANSLLRQFKQFVHLLARERRAFRRALHFDESPVASADHVHVHLGARIFVVFQIEKGRAVNDAHADRGDFTDDPGLLEVAAVSVCIVDGTPLLDLKYDEDSRAEVDMNVVCTGDGRFIEVQGTAEGAPFTREQMDELLELAKKGIGELVRLQRQAIEEGFKA